MFFPGSRKRTRNHHDVEAAIGKSYLRGGDSPRDGRLQVTSTWDFETAQPEGVIVTTELDVLAREQEEKVSNACNGRSVAP
jgi:hypothetical protein